MQLLDVDGTGTVDLDEFTKFVEHQIEVTFKSFLSDGNKDITKADLRRALFQKHRERGARCVVRPSCTFTEPLILTQTEVKRSHVLCAACPTLRLMGGGLIFERSVEDFRCALPLGLDAVETFMCPMIALEPGAPIFTKTNCYLC